jgi:hypothetical protein
MNHTKNRDKAILSGVAAMMFSLLAVAEPMLEIGGLVEVEALAAEDYAGAKTSDVTLATVELALDSEINDRLSAHIAFLYEEDATDFGLDEGTVTLGLNDSLAFTAGKMYVPFGRFDSFMVSDPQTLAMGETVETVLMLEGASSGLYGSVYLFSGDSDRASTVADGDDNELSGGFNLGYAQDGVFDVGVSYISNIADSNTLQELEVGGTNVGEVDTRVAGASAYLSATLGPVTLLGEHVGALKHFTNGDLDGSVTNEERPSASNIELGVELGGVTLAAGYQKTREALFLGLPETVTAATVAYAVTGGATLAAEYARQKDYAVSDGGSGEEATTVTVQLAVEF